MSHEITVGLNKTKRITITPSRCVAFIGEGCQVYSTPALIEDIEILCRELLLAHSQPGEDSVGTRVVLEHIAPTLSGMWVEISVEIIKREKRLIEFQIIARDSQEKIAFGNHSRFIVDTAVTAQRLRTKLAKTQASLVDNSLA